MEATKAAEGGVVTGLFNNRRVFRTDPHVEILSIFTV